MTPTRGRAAAVAALVVGSALAGGGAWLAFGPVPAPERVEPGLPESIPIPAPSPPAAALWTPVLPDNPLVQGDLDSVLLSRVNQAIWSAVARSLEDDTFLVPGRAADAGARSDYAATALAVLALLESGANRFEPRMEDADRWLQECWRAWRDAGADPGASNAWNVADCATELRSLKAKAAWRPVTTRPPRGPDVLKPFERRWAAELHALLLDRWVPAPPIALSTRHGPAAPRVGLAPGLDQRVTRDAVLGLHAASQLGIQTPATFWRRLVDDVLAAQDPHGVPVARVSPKPRQRGVSATRLALAGDVDQARGWGAAGRDGDTASRTMAERGLETCAALSTLAIAWYHESSEATTDSAMAATRRERRAFVERATHDGVAWLSRHWEDSGRPGSGRWHHAYLDALCEAAILNGHAFIGVHDWYREGCEQLLATQRSDGSWDDLYEADALASTCFALRFLARATPPLARPR